MTFICSSLLAAGTVSRSVIPVNARHAVAFAVVSLAAGTKLGPYEVTAPLGVGGMGEVYRAHDARLGRDVAVKVLPASFAADADRLRRFEQEARATSALNHPNILAIHELGTHDGAPYIVSELLEGETLRDRIGATPLPLRKAIDYGSQVAKGLAAAHEKGIVHRDLKPDNLFITRDGRVKILDFGLAKLVGGDMLTEGETNTAGRALGTDAGQVLGTVGYMSPEQVRARPVDHRSDIFSFGAVLYEMLSGKRAFRGDSAVETMNAILKEDPPSLTETNRLLPPGLERIVSHCLEKSPEERFQSAHDIAFDLEQLSGSTPTAAAVRGAPPFRFGLPLLLGGALLALGLGVAIGRLTATREGSTLSIDRLTFRRETIRRARFAPDGRSVVFESTVAGQQEPAIYSAVDGSAEARTLGLPGARLGGISSKGELAVLLRRHEAAARTLAIVPTSGGAPRDVVEDVEEADWGPDGTTLAVARWTGGGLVRLEFPAGKQLYSAAQLTNVRVSPSGDHVAFTEHPVFGDTRGDVAVIDLGGRKTTLSRGWTDLGTLAWSKDGREVLFSATRRGTEHSVHAVDLAGHERLVYLIPGSVNVADISADGRMLLSLRQGQPRILGRTRGDTWDRDLSWLDFGFVRFLSRDGRTLLFDEQGLGGGPGYSAYVRGMDGSPPVRLGSGSGEALSPDGRLALVLDLKAPDHAVLLPTGAGQGRSLPAGRIAQLHFGSFCADGKRLILLGNEAGHDGRLWEQSLDGGDPRPLTDEGVLGKPSPDGKWVVVATPRGYQLLSLEGKGQPRSLEGVLPSDDVLRFSSDSLSVIVRARDFRPVRLFRVEIGTGRRVPFKEIGPGEGASGRVANVEITDDGMTYAYTLRDQQDTLYVAQGLK